MLRRYIASRERHYYSRDRERTPLPFDWGTALAGVATNGNALEALRDFSERTLRESAGFFSCEPTSDYALEGEILRFPSAVRTAYEENNTVWGRIFPAGQELAVIVLPQWNCDWDGHVRLCTLLQRSGITSVRLSMPYHHFRKPPHLKRPEYMVSANVGQTIQASRQAVLDVRRTTDWLLHRGHHRIAIVGSSLGSCIGFLAFAHDARLSAGAFIHVSSYFSDVVWRGLSTVHVKQSLEGRIQPEDLRRIWAPISPMPYIERLRHTRRGILMFAGRYDPTFLPDLSQQAFDEFMRCGVPHRLRWLPCGHYTMGRFPFSAIVAQQLVNFLRAERDRR
jgi:hypothetical protein